MLKKSEKEVSVPVYKIDDKPVCKGEGECCMFLEISSIYFHRPVCKLLKTYPRENSKGYLVPCAKCPLHDQKVPKKLTTAVFEREDCPDWVKWATTDCEGTLCFWEKKPEEDVYSGSWYLSGGRWRSVETGWEGIAWRKSTVHRKTKK